MAVFGLKEITIEQKQKLWEARVKDAFRLSSILGGRLSDYILISIPRTYQTMRQPLDRRIGFHFKEERDCENPQEIVDCVFYKEVGEETKIFFCQHDPGDCPVYANTKEGGL